MKKKIAISKSNSKFVYYVKWVEDNNQPYTVLDWDKNNFEDIKDCSSLLLTGGADIYPEFYSDWSETSISNNNPANEYFPERDGFEFKLIDYAIDSNMPVLGICRGMQLINCRLNGSLINDIETIRGVNHRKIADNEDRYHRVNVKIGTLLSEITGEQSGIINSSHHQGIDRVGEGLKISARSSDGIIEGLEWDESGGKPFLLAIQWHPERMNDKSSPFTRNIIERFIQVTNNS